MSGLIAYIISPLTKTKFEKEKNSMMKRSGLAAIAILFGLMMPALLTTPAHAKVTQNMKIPLDQDVEIPGVEWVHLTGYMHQLVSVTEDGGGGFHMTMHGNSKGIGGIGMTSGDKYRMTGASVMKVNVKPPYPSVFAWVSNAHIIGPRPGNNYLVYIRMHITVNANGEVTAAFREISFEVK